MQAELEIPALEELRGRRGRKWTRFPPDVIPAWIADMDYLPAACIRNALREALDRGDLGYGAGSALSGVPQSFVWWAARRWGWEIDTAQIEVMPDIVGGIANCIEALTSPEDAVIVLTPIYPPFLSTVRASGRRLVTQALNEDRIDFAALDELARTHAARMILLCNPHNPLGRSYTREELQQLANIAAAREMIVVSDEVHADLTYPGYTHTPFAMLGEEVRVRTVTLNSASKAFNIAGLRTAVCIAQDGLLLQRLRALPPSRWTAFSTFGVRATRAAWSEEGAAWLGACMSYLAKMRELLIHKLPEVSPGIRWRPPEATYLAWLDCRALSLEPNPARFFLERARVALSPGHEFGAPGTGFARLNFATSAVILEEILSRMSDALRRPHT